MKKVAVFDLDGTLIDSKKLYIDTIHHSLLEHYFIYPKSHISRALGPKVEITLKRINKFSPKILKKLKDRINNDISKKASRIKLAPYAKEALQRLKSKNYAVILLTNSAGKFANAILKRNKILKYFSRLYYSEKFSSKENAIKAIAKKYKTKVKNITYVADKMSDVKIARKAGCRIVIVLAKSWDKKKVKGKRYAIKSLRQLKL
jgi:HAD superfamily hydrolase (TIGR01549 family)